RHDTWIWPVPVQSNAGQLESGCEPSAMLTPATSSLTPTEPEWSQSPTHTGAVTVAVLAAVAVALAVEVGGDTVAVADAVGVADAVLDAVAVASGDGVAAPSESIPSVIRTFSVSLDASTVRSIACPSATLSRAAPAGSGNAPPSTALYRWSGTDPDASPGTRRVTSTNTPLGSGWTPAAAAVPSSTRFT